MVNEILANGSPLELVAPSGGVVAGQPYLIGGMVVVAVVTAAQGETFACKRGNVVQLAKATGTGALGQGVLVQWDPTPGNVVAEGVVTGNFDLGFLLEAVADGDTTAKVVLTTERVVAE